MSLPIFPSELRGPLRAGFSLAYGDSRSFFAAEAGPLVPRSRLSRVADPLAFTLDLDRMSLAVFERFWRDRRANGALPFLMPDPMTDGWFMLDAAGDPMTMANGQPMLIAKTLLCIFGEKTPAVTPAARRTRFNVAVNMLVMP